MTPDELIHELRKLVTAHQFQEALDLTSRILPEIRSSITSEQVVRIAEPMHLAQMAVDVEAWDAANGQAPVAAQDTPNAQTEARRQPSHRS